MTFEGALRQRLLDTPDVVALVGKTKRSRAPVIEWVTRPDDSEYPAVVLQVILSPIARVMRGVRRSRAPRVQIDVLATSAGGKVALTESLIAALAPAATVGGIAFRPMQDIQVADLSEQTDTLFIHRDRIAATFWHSKLET